MEKTTWYYQIQGQMAVTGINITDLVLTGRIFAKVSVRSYNLEISFIAAFRHHFTNGFSELHSAPQTTSIRSARGTRRNGMFPWNIFKSFNLSIALSTWMHTYEICLVDFFAALDNCLPENMEKIFYLCPLLNRNKH